MSKYWEIRQWLNGGQRVILRNLELKEAYEEWKKIKEKGIYSIYRSPKKKREEEGK